MSVVVATAYMEEAERFDWLVAMNAGKVVATGSPAELRQRVGAGNIEEAFIALLPERERAGHHALQIPCRFASGCRTFNAIVSDEESNIRAGTPKRKRENGKRAYGHRKENVFLRNGCQKSMDRMAKSIQKIAISDGMPCGNDDSPR